MRAASIEDDDIDRVVSGTAADSKLVVLVGEDESDIEIVVDTIVAVSLVVVVVVVDDSEES